MNLRKAGLIQLRTEERKLSKAIEKLEASRSRVEDAILNREERRKRENEKTLGVSKLSDAERLAKAESLIKEWNAGKPVSDRIFYSVYRKSEGVGRDFEKRLVLPKERLSEVRRSKLSALANWTDSRRRFDPESCDYSVRLIFVFEFAAEA